jgi:hypothetical protein
MKKMKVIASLLIGVFGLAMQIHATQQEAGPEVKQHITKKAKTVAAHASVSYEGLPQFSPIGGTSISYATNTPQEIINIGDAFYLNLQGVWLVSANAQGPWRAAQSVPKVVPAIVCSRLKFNPSDPYQLCVLPWANG